MEGVREANLASIGEQHMPSSRFQGRAQTQCSRPSASDVAFDIVLPSSSVFAPHFRTPASSATSKQLVVAARSRVRRMNRTLSLHADSSELLCFFSMTTERSFRIRSCKNQSFFAPFESARGSEEIIVLQFVTQPRKRLSRANLFVQPEKSVVSFLCCGL